jgi:hypothetical protein
MGLGREKRPGRSTRRPALARAYACRARSTIASRAIAVKSLLTRRSACATAALARARNGCAAPNTSPLYQDMLIACAAWCYKHHMPSPRRDFPLEYVVGALGVPRGRITSMVTNVGDAVGTVRVLIFRRWGYIRSDLAWDSDVEISPELGPPTPDVPAGAVWRYSQQVWDPDEYWLRIQVTSSKLVPSAQFDRLEEQNGFRREVPFAFYAPGDFAVFRRRVRLLPGVEATADDDLVLTE